MDDEILVLKRENYCCALTRFIIVVVGRSVGRMLAWSIGQCFTEILLFGQDCVHTSPWILFHCSVSSIRNKLHFVAVICVAWPCSSVLTIHPIDRPGKQLRHRERCKHFISSSQAIPCHTFIYYHANAHHLRVDSFSLWKTNRFEIETNTITPSSYLGIWENLVITVVVIIISCETTTTENHHLSNRTVVLKGSTDYLR